VQGDGKFEVTQSKHRLTEDQKHGDGQKLFDFCAECLKNFINTTLRNDKGWTLKEGEKIPLGFTVRIFIRTTNGVYKHSEI
jgi:hexokinase